MRLLAGHNLPRVGSLLVGHGLAAGLEIDLPVDPEVDPPITEVSSVTQGNIEYTFDAPAKVRQSLDGAWVVEGPVTVTSVTPASTGSGADMRSGSVLNPIFERDPNHAGQAWDGRDVSTFDAATAVTYPVALSVNDVLVKGVSAEAAADDRDGWLSEVSALYVVEDLDALPAGDFLSPSAIGWTGRGALEFTPCDPDAAIAAITTVDTSAHANAVDYATVAAQINRWQGLAAYDDGAHAGGYQAWFTFGTGTLGSNYGRYLYRPQEEALLGLMGQTWTAEQKRALIVSMAQIGVHLIQVGRGFGDVKDGDGGHHQWQLPAAMMAMLCCPGLISADQLYDTITTNQLRQSFIFDAALLARLAPHDSDSEPMDFRRRSIAAIDGNTVTLPFNLGGERPRWHPSDAKKMVSDNGAEVVLVAGQSANTFRGPAVSFDVVDASSFNVGDEVWFEPVVPFNIGDPAWVIWDLQSFNGFDLSPNSLYIPINNQYIALVLFMLASGLGEEPAFQALIRHQEARVYGWRDYPEPFETRWSEDFWNQHGVALFETTIGTDSRHYPLYGPAQRFNIDPQAFSPVTLPDNTIIIGVGIYTSGRLIGYITDDGNGVVIAGENVTLTPDVGDTFILDAFNARGDHVDLPVQIAEGGAIVAELPDSPSVVNVMLFGQSQVEFLVNTGVVYRQIAQPQDIPTEPNVTMWTDPTVDGSSPPVKTIVTQASVNAGMVNPVIANWSVLFHRLMPGVYFNIFDGCVPGTSRLSLFQSAHVEFRWPGFTNMLNAIAAEGLVLDALIDCWQGNDSQTAQRYIEEWFPGMFGQRGNGQPFTLGTPNPDSIRNAGVEIDNCLWDLEAPDNQLGRGVFRKDQTKLWFTGWPTFSGAKNAPATLFNSSTETDGSPASSYPTHLDRPARAILEQVLADPRIAPFAGELIGTAHIANMNGGVHPVREHSDGQILQSIGYAMAILRVAGFEVYDPTVSGVEAAADGTYADILFDLPNGGNLTTIENLESRATAAVEPPHYQPVMGIELRRDGTTDAERRPIYKMNEAAMPAAYRGAIQIIDSGSGSPRRGRVRVTPSEQFQNNDILELLPGDASSLLSLPRDADAKLYLRQLMEHVPAWHDPTTTYPLPGVGLKPHADSLVLSGITGTGPMVWDVDFGENTIIVITAPAVEAPTATFGENTITVTG